MPEDALRRSVVHSGHPGRLQKLFKKVLAGVIGAQRFCGSVVKSGNSTLYKASLHACKMSGASAVPCFFKKLWHTGENIAAVVLGGSISAGGETRHSDSEAYFAQTTVRTAFLTLRQRCTALLFLQRIVFAAVRIVDANCR